jgi:hypothetical protein
MWEEIALFFVKFDAETRFQRYEIKETMAQFIDELDVAVDLSWWGPGHAIQQFSGSPLYAISRTEFINLSLYPLKIVKKDEKGLYEDVR